MKIIEIFKYIVQTLIERFGNAPLCNGKAERALKIGNFVFPLCYRCTFIMLGLIIAIICILYVTDKKMIKWKKWFLVPGGLLIIPTFLDGLIQTFSDYVSTNFKRSITGFFAGIGVSICLYTMIFIVEEWLIKHKKKKIKKVKKAL